MDTLFIPPAASSRDLEIKERKIRLDHITGMQSYDVLFFIFCGGISILSGFSFWRNTVLPGRFNGMGISLPYCSSKLVFSFVC